MLKRIATFRSALYARMEEISFRSAIAVVTGVVAVAAVVAGVGLVMTQASAPAQSTALGPAPAARSSTRPSATPTAWPPSPSAPASSAPASSGPASSAPARTPAPVRTSPAREATYPATAENAQRVPAQAPSAARRPISSATAAWLAWWQRVLASRRGTGLRIGHGGSSGPHWGRR